MSHTVPSKTQFYDLWREEADCLAIVQVQPEMDGSWDNVDVGTWKSYSSEPHANAEVAKQICFSCPVREACLRDALSDNEAEGVRAGYRFEDGKVSRRDARNIFNEWGLRAKVKKTRTVVSEDVESDEVQGVREDD